MGCRSLVFTVALVSGLFQYAHGMKPKMTPDEDTLFIDSHQKLEIECYSKYTRVQFSFPESTLLVPRTGHEIHDVGNGSYTFVRKDARPSDTGWYACAEEGVKINNDFRTVNHTDENVSWIYVWVIIKFSNGSPTDPYFVNSNSGPHPNTIISVPGSVVVIPCLPSQPTRNVELWQNGKLVDLEKEAVRFDPKIGFIMKQVEFLDNESILQCRSKYKDEAYIVRYSESRPTMITPEDDKDLILQEGDVLRIECFSESKLSFLYPTILTNSSTYEIVENKNGTSTFFRHSVISDDTGWYGCAGMGIRNNDIPAYSINSTKKEISWVYVYVNSPVKIISPFMDTALSTSGDIQRVFVIPCRPTSPELHIQSEKWDGKIWIPERYHMFDPKVGFTLSESVREQSVYRCATTGPVRYVSKNYSIADVDAAMKPCMKPAILNVDDPSNSDDLIIRMTGDDLRIRCDTVASASPWYLMEWTVPSTVSPSRIEYNRTRSDGRIYRDVIHLRSKTLTITVTNLSETDSGEYSCSVTSDMFSETDSRTVKVFDKSGLRYLKAVRDGRQTNRFNIAGRKGKDIEWLLDMTDFPSAEIQQSFFRNAKRRNITSLLEIQAASTRGAPLFLFRIGNLTTSDRGLYLMFIRSKRGITKVYVDIDVQEPPNARLNSTKGLLQAAEMRIDARCRSVGSPEPNITIAIAECPKYPSLENCNLRYGREFDNESDKNEWGIYGQQFSISMSGILTCEACNVLGCSVAREDILYYASDEPYFTSTNLHKTEVVLDMVTRGSSKTLTLECYVAGNPYPDVTWFLDDVKLEDSREHKFAYDNRELNITYYPGDEGGRYTCKAENVHGLVENHIDIRLPALSDQKNLFSTSVIIVFVTLLVLIIICCIVIYKLCVKASKKKLSDLAFEKGALERFNPELSIVDQAELLPYDLKWEYPRGLLKFAKTLGSGAFGIVKKAEAKSICRGEAVTTVAVKMVRSTATLNFMTALTRELKILAYLGKHPNVVNLLGACTKNVFFGELYVIVEYCRFGNLRDHLLNRRADFVDELQILSENTALSRFGQDCVNTNDRGLHSNVDGTKHSFHGTAITETSEASDDDCDEDHDSGDAERWRSKYEGDCTDLGLEPISTQDLVYWSWQVSRAMEFLGERKIVHGDLAARNILLADNGIVKVCDFGLAKALYKEAEYRDTGSNPLPIKWMAIESIKDRVFSVQSDVWSFGVVMWEFFTLGETPYSGVRLRGLYQKLVDGFRMEHPKYAQMTIYDMMQLCWEADPTKRPSFADLSHNLGDLLDHDFKAQYLEMHAHYMEINAEIVDNGKADYLTLSLDATPASKMQEPIEMKSLPQDVSENAV